MNTFINVLTQEALVDVVVSGFVDEDEFLKFNPMYDRLYFVFSNAIFELYIGEDGYVKAKNIEKIEAWFDIEEDDRFALMSIYSQLFKTERQVTVSKIDYSNIPFTEIAINYYEDDFERELKLEPKNFFGFTFL